MNLNDRLVVPDDVFAREVGGETVLLDLATGIYFGLDAVGARIWQQIESENATLAEACDVVEREYDVSREQLERDVLALAERLLEHGLVATAE